MPLVACVPTLDTARVNRSPLSPWFTVAGLEVLTFASGAGAVKLAALVVASLRAVTVIGPGE